MRFGNGHLEWTWSFGAWMSDLEPRQSESALIHGTISMQLIIIKA